MRRPIEIPAFDSLPIRILDMLVARGPLTGTELVEKSGTSASSVSRAANALVGAGYAIRQISDDDMRCIRFHVTRRGRNVNTRARALRSALGQKDT